jgi:hypothetical protein
LTNNSTGGNTNVIGGVMVMMVSVDGHWTGEVRCDDTRCPKYLSQEKIKRRGLMERGWQCIFHRHHCPEHHKTAEWFAKHVSPDAVPFVEQWATRYAEWRASQGLLSSDPPATPDTPIEGK